MAPYRSSHDSSLEGTGFEPSVPLRKRRPSREAPRPTIVVSRGDLRLMTPSNLSVRHLSSATAERPFTRAGPTVRNRRVSGELGSRSGEQKRWRSIADQAFLFHSPFEAMSAPADISRLILFIANRNELRQLASGAVRPEVFCVALARQFDHGGCCSKDRLRRSIVPVELSRSPPAG